MTETKKKPGGVVNPEDLDPNQSAEPMESTQSSRQTLVTVYLTGDNSSAKGMFDSLPGATDDGWSQIDRMLSPVQRFILDGGMPYVQATVGVEQYQGIPTPPETEVIDPDEPYVEPTARTPATQSGLVPAAELIARAEAATTTEELDEIARLAQERVTVLDAVEFRLTELEDQKK